jgi:hypothetical protein
MLVPLALLSAGKDSISTPMTLLLNATRTTHLELGWRCAVRLGKPIRINLWPIPVDLVLVSDPDQIQAMKADPGLARLHTVPTSEPLSCKPTEQAAWHLVTAQEGYHDSLRWGRQRVVSDARLGSLTW